MIDSQQRLWVLTENEIGYYSLLTSTSQEPAKNNDWSISPNPATDLVKVSFLGNETAWGAGVKLTISNLDGEELFSVNKEGTEDVNMDISHLPGGVYFISAMFENGKALKPELLIISR